MQPTQAGCLKYPLLPGVTDLTQWGGEQKLLNLLITQFYPVSRYWLTSNQLFQLLQAIFRSSLKKYNPSIIILILFQRYN